MNHRFLKISLCSVLSLLGPVSHSWACDSNNRIVSVSGESSVKAKVDVGYVSFSVSQSGLLAADAIKAANDKAVAIKKEIEEMFKNDVTNVRLEDAQIGDGERYILLAL